MADFQISPDKKQPSPKSFRIDEETAAKIKEIASKIGGNQQEAFSALIEAYEFEQGKAAIPERSEEIEIFHSKLHDVEEIYKKVLEQYRDQDVIIRSQYDNQLRSKDKTIQQLQGDLEKLKLEYDRINSDMETAKKVAADAEDRKKNAEELAKQAKDAADAAKGQIQDKQDMIDRISRDLKAADEKSAQYDNLKAKFEAAIGQKEKTEQALKDAKRDAEEAAKDAKRAAERELEEAVSKAKESGRIALEKSENTISDLKNQISNLKDQLREATSVAEIAKKDAENAKNTAIAEISNAHAKELEEIRSLLDKRTEELVRTKDELLKFKPDFQPKSSNKSNK